MNATTNEFRTELQKRILQYIKSARRDGTTGMSRDNLFQCVRPPSESMSGAPRGTNARYYYSQMFTEICQDAGISKFILA